MKKALLIFGLIAASAVITGCEESSPVASNPEPTQQQMEHVRCSRRGGVWVYDNNGFTCANPSPVVGR